VPADFAGPATGFPKDARTGAISKVAVEGADDKNAWFHLAVPKAYTPDRAWPLMIVLHGGPGGNGPDDIITFFRGGLTAQGVISVYPNAIKRQLLEWNYPHEGANLIAIIRQTARTYRVDPCRIYLAGVSMGGGGAWANGAVLRDVFAAIGPIAGWYQPAPAPKAEWLKDMPIYCLHGENDPAVPVSRAQVALAAMKEIGHNVLEVADLADFKAIGKETMVYRVVKGAQHNVLLPWDKQGRHELGKMVGWMLAQKRPAPADIAAAEKSLAAWGKQFGWAAQGLLGKYDEGHSDKPLTPGPSAPGPSRPR
jgi:predicted peptidase